MIEPSEAEVEAAVRAECQFDKWDYDAMPKSARERYFARTSAALTAATHVRAVNVSGAQVEAVLRELGITHPSIDDVARVNRAIMAAAGCDLPRKSTNELIEEASQAGAARFAKAARAIDAVDDPEDIITRIDTAS
jgi:predicted flap endonuclease-1-like 5' DNA nuclease